MNCITFSSKTPQILTVQFTNSRRNRCDGCCCIWSAKLC